MKLLKITKSVSFILYTIIFTGYECYSDCWAVADYDPLQYIFKVDNATKVKESNRSIAVYQQHLLKFYNFILEGEQLENSCQHSEELTYFDSIEQQNLIRSLAATLQYLGLDLSARAIAEYAKKMEFTADEYKNLVARLIGNYCSLNLSVISLKKLGHNFWKNFYAKKTSIQLADLADNPLFPATLSKRIDKNKAQELEFLRTIKLFRAFCSWNGDTNNFRLLVPLLRNPVILAYVINNLSQKKDRPQEKYSIEEEKSLNYDPFYYLERPIQVGCNGPICRRIYSEYEFKRKFLKSLNYNALKEKLSWLYCRYLRDLKYITSNQQEEHIKKWIREMEVGEQTETPLLQSKMLSLITNMPDLMGKISNFNEAKELLRTGIDEEWNLWAQNASKAFTFELGYEESVTLERVRWSGNDQNIVIMDNYARPLESSSNGGAKITMKDNWALNNWSIIFDVNMGEFDRLTKGMGKVEVTYPLLVDEAFLAWFWGEWVTWALPEYKEKRNKLVEVLEKNLRDDTKKVQQSFLTPPWETGFDLTPILAQAIIENLEQIKINLSRLSKKKITVEVKFRYGLYALKYMNYRFRMRHGEGYIDRRQ